MDRLLKFTTWVYGSKMMRIIRDTLKMMFPIILFGSFAEVLQITFLTPTGFMAVLFGITKWLPFHKDLAWGMGVIYHCTIDMVAIYSAYGSAYFTAKVYGRKSSAAGAMGLLAFLIVAYQPNQDGLLNFNPRLMSNGMFFSLIIGYLCGRLMVKLVNLQKEELFQLLKPVSIIIFSAAIVNLILGFVGRLEIPSYVATFVTEHSQVNSLMYVLGMGLLTNVLSWLAIGGPFMHAPSFTDAASLANMNAALKAKSVWNVPFKFTDTTLYHSFANFGGTGVMLALIIAILIFSKKKVNRNTSKWAIFPAIFNNNYPMMFGIPVLFNPIMFFPFVLAPFFNMLVAALFLSLRWMPTSAYPVPYGTPGPLIAFIGTNGNWWALIFGAILICLDVLIYMPFVKLADKTIEEVGDDDEAVQAV